MSAVHSVLITGASTGIGKACALWMDRLGWRVFAGVRKAQDADQLRQEGSNRLQPIFIDVTDSDSIAGAAAEIEQTLAGQGLHGLVNNAGVAFGAILEFMPLDHLRQQLEINVVGQLAVTQPMIPHLRTVGGRIVNMSSIAGRCVSPVLGPYAASKFALEALTDALRYELHAWGIHVAAVEPGDIATPIWEKSLAEAKKWLDSYPPEAQQLYGPLIDGALKKVGNRDGSPADEVAKAVAHALTAPQPKIRYVVGRDAQIRLLLDKLPDALVDRIIFRQLPAYGDQQ